MVAPTRWSFTLKWRALDTTIAWRSGNARYHVCMCKREGFNLLPFEYISSRPRIGAMSSLIEEEQE